MNIPRIGRFEYFLFPKLKGKNNYGSYICLDFYDTRIQEKHIRKA